MQQDPEDTLNNAADAAGDAAHDAADAVGDAAQGAADAVGNAADAVADTAADVADSAADLGNQAVAATGDAVDSGLDAGDAAVAAVAGAAVATAAGVGDAVDEAQATVDQAIQTATGGSEAQMTTSPAQPPAQTYSSDLTTPQHRPAGISVLGTLAVLWGLLKISILAVASSGWAVITAGSLSAGFLAGGASFLAGILWIAIGIGFFKLKSWVWMLSLFVAGWTVLELVLSILNPTGVSLVCGMFYLIVPGIFLWYLTRPHVKAAFGR